MLYGEDSLKCNMVGLMYCSNLSCFYTSTDFENCVQCCVKMSNLEYFLLSGFPLPWDLGISAVRFFSTLLRFWQTRSGHG